MAYAPAVVSYVFNHKPAPMQKMLLTLLAAIILASCGSTHHNQGGDIKDDMDAWIGHHKAELIRAWGPPQYYASDGRDGEILIYQRTETYAEVVYGRYYERTVHPYKMFYADAYGNIYYWRTGE